MRSATQIICLLWLGMAGQALSEAQPQQAPDDEFSCIEHLQHRFFTKEGRRLRAQWRVLNDSAEPAIVANHPASDYRAALRDARLFATDDLALHRVATAYVDAFYQLAKLAFLVSDSRNIAEIRQVLFEYCSTYADTGLQVHLFLGPGWEGATESNAFAEWLVALKQAYPRHVFLIYSREASSLAPWLAPVPSLPAPSMDRPNLRLLGDASDPS